MAEQHPGFNGFNKTQISGYIAEIDLRDDQLDSLRSDYMLKCKTPRAAIREIKAAVKEAGINRKAFEELLTQHREDRAALKRVAAMEADDAADLEALQEALGEYADTPLGAAALKRAGAGEETLDSLSQ
jgi:hypothetical protein